MPVQPRVPAMVTAPRQNTAEPKETAAPETSGAVKELTAETSAPNNEA